jgi:hypothetical protein
MHTHIVKVTAAGKDERPRDSLGGAALLPTGMAWPRCECGERMTLFFQFDIPDEFGLPFATGAHLAVFMCHAHNEAPEQFQKHALPAKFWRRRRQIDGRQRFYEILLFAPADGEQAHPPEPHLVPRGLQFMRKPEEVHGRQGFKVGGCPFWYQAPSYHACPCGADMRFLCQLPENYPFRKAKGAPPENDPFSQDDYGLFLGNGVYLLACEARCSPFAVHPVVQN